MIQADSGILKDTVIQKLQELNVNYYVLQRSKCNTIAFTTLNGRRREFEVTFLKDRKYLISTRFLGYVDVLIRNGYDVISGNDPDGRRRIYRLKLDDTEKVNNIIYEMLESGYSSNPQICLI